jgi:hypothetical protein
VSFSTCPIATVNAPVERVWHLLSDPRQYALWWDAETCAIDPAGPAQAGQTIEARTKALGTWWDVHIAVERVDADRHQLDLTTRLPFGITVHNLITCAAVEDGACRVSFG